MTQSKAELEAENNLTKIHGELFLTLGFDVTTHVKLDKAFEDYKRVIIEEYNKSIVI